MLAEVIEDQLSLNAALPRTLRALLLHPGLLSTEYLDGRIQRYIPPFRLYLVSSVVFFLLLSLLSGQPGTGIVKFDGEVVVDTTRSVTELIQRADTAPDGTPIKRDLRLHTGWERLDTLAIRRMRELLALPPGQLFRKLFAVFLQRAPTAVFLVLPLYALLLQLLFFRRRRYYVEHFVFALHTHAFVFVLFTIMLIGMRLPLIGPLLIMWQFVYGFLALKRYYGQGRFITLLKYGLLGVMYSVVFGLGLLSTVVVALLLG
jgi:hypothetical protein